MDRQVIIGSYDVDDMDSYSVDDFYRGEDEEIVRVRTQYGTMWVPLINQSGAINAQFDPRTEKVLIFLIDPDYIIGYSSEEELIMQSDVAFGMVIKSPPQFRREAIMSTRNDRSAGGGNDSTSLPRTMIGSDSRWKEGVSFGMPNAKVVATEDKIMIKGPGGEIIIGKEGILLNGKVVNLDFFNESRAGLLSNNWLGELLPPSVKVAVELGTGTPMPTYLPDDMLLRRVAGIAETVMEMNT